MTRIATALLALVLAGCAPVQRTFDKPDMVPGKSTEKDLAQGYGKPVMEVRRPGGERLLYFVDYRWGREMDVAVLGPDGVLLRMEQRLTGKNVYSIKAGMREQEVRELLGPPREIAKLERQGLTVWEYPWVEAGKEMRILWVHFDAGGTVREVVEMHDEIAEPRGP